ncbi:MAG: hypothetical protein H6722_13575 [Sandaracinus sp.]|nr:hypothetical protein [Sandaracinus sp.]MCB9619744.1 hypothetical protein [Sandaracinus sp.]
MLHGLDDVARAELARTAPAFLEALGSGDLDGDGAPDFDRPFALRVAISTADLGDDCEDRPHALVERDGSRAVIVSDPTAIDPAAIDEVVARLNDARSECSLGQPLEALRRALELPFDGVVEPNSRLVVVFASPHDDCSIPHNPSADPSHVVGCTAVERADVAEYARRFTAENELHVLTLTGLPTDLDGLSRPLEGESVLARTDLSERLDGDVLVPSCTRGELQATPPRRWLAWSDALVEHGVFGQHASLCATDLAPAFEAFAARIARHDTADCIHSAPGPLGPDGLLPCEAIDDSEDCAEREDRVVTELGCAIPQVGPGESGGWYFESPDDALEGSDLAWICPHGWSRLVGARHEATRLVCASGCME